MAFCWSWHKQPDVLAALKDFYDEYARPPDSSEAKQDMLQKLEAIGSHLKEQGFPFKGVEYIGSTYENLKVSNGLEFDILVVLGGRGFTAAPTDNPQYSLIEPKVGLPPPNLHPWMQKDGVVTAENIALKFFGCLAKLSANNSKFSKQHGVVFRKHGPAIEMHVDTPGLKYSADLVPTFRVENIYYVARPRRKEPNAWLRSHSIEMKQELDGFDKDNGCRKQVGRTFKALCKKKSSGLGKISSHHVKMALLLEVEEHPEKSWQQSQFAHRFFDLLRRVANYIEEGYFPYPYVRGVNLVQPLEDGVKNRLMKLHNKKNAFLKAISVEENQEAKKGRKRTDIQNEGF